MNFGVLVSTSNVTTLPNSSKYSTAPSYAVTRARMIAAAAHRWTEAVRRCIARHTPVK